MSTASSLAVTEHGMLLGGQIRGILDLIRKARDLGIDLSKLNGLLPKMGELFAAEDLKTKVIIGLETLELFAQATTKTDVDDQIAAVARKILVDAKLLDLLLPLLQGMMGGSTMDAETRVATIAEFEAKAIDWASLMQIVQLLAVLLGNLRK